VDKPKEPVDCQKDPQDHLEAIESWTNSWRIKPNPLKSQSILMTHSRASRTRSLLQNQNLILNNSPIPILQNIRYLGVTFSQNCTLTQDLKETLKKNQKPCKPPIQGSRAPPRMRPENSVPHLQIIHPSNHRIPCQPQSNFRLRKKNSPTHLPTPLDFSLCALTPENQNNPNPRSTTRPPKTLRHQNLKFK
jgi:hypothetical protein